MDKIAIDGSGNLSVSVSWLGIFLAVVAAMVIGSIWYGPIFGKKWMKILKLKRGESSPTGPMLIMLALSIIQAFVVAHFIVYVSYFYPTYSDLSVGLLTGLWAFVGFVLPALVSKSVFEKGSVDLLKINLGNQLVTLAAIGAILGTVN
jgi:hypothetical protein